MLHILQQEWYEIPNLPRYRGTGAPGNFLEDLLGLTVGSMDIADTVGWEIKYFTDKTNLITLFHKEPKPNGIVTDLVKQYGWKDNNGRLSFRHTISGKSDRCKVVYKNNQIQVHPLKQQIDPPIPYWIVNDLLNSAIAKLRRLLLVNGEKKGNHVCFHYADCLEDIYIELFIAELVKGTINIDFDARESKPGSKGLRNHGTKFRINPKHICWIYTKKERLS